MWLSGSRFRKRIGRNGLAYFLYFAISRSIGTMLARMLRWVMMTPFGSAVAPEVKMISARRIRRRRDALETRRRRDGCRRSPAWNVGPAPPSGGRSPAAPTRPDRPRASETVPVDGVADEHGARIDDRDDPVAGTPPTRGSRSGRGRRPSSRQPHSATIHSARFSPQIATRCPLAIPARAQPVGERARGRATSRVGVRPAAIAVVVDDELAVESRRDRRRNR